LFGLKGIMQTEDQIILSAIMSIIENLKRQNG